MSIFILHVFREKSAKQHIRARKREVFSLQPGQKGEKYMVLYLNSILLPRVLSCPCLP